MAGRKYSTRYAKFQVSGYASRGGTRFGANEKTYLKKYFFGYVFRSRYVFFLPTKVVLGSNREKKECTWAGREICYTE
jgi:hypothetical protein